MLAYRLDVHATEKIVSFKPTFCYIIYAQYPAFGCIGFALYLPHKVIAKYAVIISEYGKGEFILSRNVKEISRSRGAQAVIAGTYALGADSVYVTVRLIRATDGKILSSYDYTLRMDDNILYLVGARFRDIR